MSPPEFIHIEQIGTVRRIWLNRDNARNAQSTQLLDELDHALTGAKQEESVRVLILGAKGKHFSAGHDLKEAQEKRSNFSVEERWAFEEKRYFAYCLALWDFPKPTIAQVQGACIAAGFMLANMCDLIVAAYDGSSCRGGPDSPVGHGGPPSKGISLPGRAHARQARL
jgi:enoyl-CoA hydratase